MLSLEVAQYLNAEPRAKDYQSYAHEVHITVPQHWGVLTHQEEHCHHGVFPGCAGTKTKLLLSLEKKDNRLQAEGTRDRLGKSNPNCKQYDCILLHQMF